MKNTYLVERNLFTNNQDVKFNMFGSLVLNWICGEVDSGDIVAVDEGSFGNKQWSSSKRLRIHVVSATALATPRYSASALERDTVCCLFEDHEMSLSPKKTQYPEVDRRVLGHPAQSASA